MAKNRQDELIRACAVLQSLQQNIHEETSLVEETLVKDYHGALDKLSAANINVSEFRIPDAKIAPRKISADIHSFSSGATSKVIYSEEKYVDKIYFLSKLDTVYNYLTKLTSAKPKRMGFNTNKE